MKSEASQNSQIGNPESCGGCACQFKLIGRLTESVHKPRANKTTFFFPSLKQKGTWLSRKFAIIKSTKHWVAAGCVCNSPASPPTGPSRAGASINRLLRNSSGLAIRHRLRNWTKQTWVRVQLPNCHRHGVYHPMSRPTHLPESQQRPQLWPESAALPWADLQLQNCLRRCQHHPK